MSFFNAGNIFSVFELLKAVPIPLIIPAPGSTDTGNKNERPNCSKAETNLLTGKCQQQKGWNMNIGRMGM